MKHEEYSKAGSKRNKRIRRIFAVALVAILVSAGIAGGWAWKQNSKSTDDFTNDKVVISEEGYNTFTTAENSFMEREREFLSSDGYVESDDVPELLNLVEDELQELIDNDVVEDYSRDDYCIYIEFTSGIKYLFIPPMENTLGGQGGVSVYGLEPSKNTMKFQIDTFLQMLLELVPEYEGEVGAFSIYPSIRSVAEVLGTRYQYIEDEEVTVDSMKKISDYNVVVFQGHGAYNESTHSALVTGEQAPTFGEIKKYKDDIADGCIAITSSIFQGDVDGGITRYFAVTSKFFEKYLGKMDNTFVYLGACLSAKDSVLAQSFIDKGAKVVLGFDDTVCMPYEMCVQRNLFYYLTDKSSEPLSLQEAISKTIAVCSNTWTPTNLVVFPTSLDTSTYFPFRQPQSSTVSPFFPAADVQIEQYTGTWPIEVEKTNNENADSNIQTAFGTGFKYGNHLTLNADGSMSWWVGISCGGEGTYKVLDDTIHATYTYTDSDDEQTLDLQVVHFIGTDDVYLHWDYDGFQVYWVKEKTEAEKNEIYQEVADAYQQFISRGQYRTAIDTEERWIGSAVQECAGVQWGNSANGYAILDIDGDGTPELLIRSDCSVEDDWYYAAVFSFDTDSQKVRLLAELHPYGEITHSDYYSAIQYYDQFSYTSGKTDFYTMRNNELVLMYSIIFDADYYWGDDKYGRWWYEDSHGTTELTKTDYDTYFQDAEAVKFQPIAADNLDVNENPAKEPEITNNADSADTTSTELTDYYWYRNVQSWEVYEFCDDGTFRVYYTEMPITPSENTQLSQADLVSSGQSGRYDFDGEKLTMYPDNGASYSMDLYDRSRDPYPDDDAAQYVSDYDGTIYFYETDWEPVEIAGIVVTDHSYLVRLGKKA